MKDIEIKKELFERCAAYVFEKMETVQKAIQAAQDSANAESKSSMGDKYETGRAMAQLEIEKNLAQLNEFQKIKQDLDRTPWEQTASKVQKGSLVYTSLAIYFLSISAGKIVLRNETYFAVSLLSPIAKSLVGLKEGDDAVFNGKAMKVLRIM